MKPIRILNNQESQSSLLFSNFCIKSCSLIFANPFTCLFFHTKQEKVSRTLFSKSRYVSTKLPFRRSKLAADEEIKERISDTRIFARYPRKVMNMNEAKQRTVRSPPNVQLVDAADASFSNIWYSFRLNAKCVRSFFVGMLLRSTLACFHSNACSWKRLLHSKCSSHDETASPIIAGDEDKHALPKRTRPCSSSQA